MILKESLLELPLDLDRERLPSHVAVIMDGNGRWAQRRGLPRIMGHPKGVDSLRELVRCCDDWRISALTVYAFSTENWGRPIHEVTFLMALFEQFLKRELPEMMERKIRLRFAGNLETLPESLQAEIERSIGQTKDNQGVQFTVAMNYGGRQEIIEACRKIAREVERGSLHWQDINEKLFEANLYTAPIPHPDLLIRTSGEMRISNFLLWQVAYTEIYVTDTLWPDFDRYQFFQALLNYQQRDRRFGKLNR